MFVLHVFQANLRKQCLISQQNIGPLDSERHSGRTPPVNRQHPGLGVKLAKGSAAMDQTVITSCSKDKLQSDLWEIFNQGRVCLCEKEAEQTGEVSMKKNERVGGVCIYVNVCVNQGEQAARSSVTCLNGTRWGARTEPLRLIGHSNVTRSLPKQLGGDTWPSEGVERSLWREEMEQRV